jgi:GNAT superfamily N-acetyltransferase
MVDFDRHRLSFLDENEITLISHDVFTSLGKASSPAARGLLAEVIDKLGAASAKAQGYQVSSRFLFLFAPTPPTDMHCSRSFFLSPQPPPELQIITSTAKFLNNPSQRLFVHTECGKAIGFIKVGYVTLFVYNQAGVMQRIEPLCVLDFFVAEAWQRHGVGRRLFDTMLSHEHALPARMGYDRPSPKFLSFLQRHFRLQKFLPQTNGFVVFDDYFLGMVLGSDC